MLSKNLSRRSIYASFSENVLSFWGLRPRPLPGSCPWTVLGDFCPSDPFVAQCPPLEKKSCRTYGVQQDPYNNNDDDVDDHNIEMYYGAN